MKNKSRSIAVRCSGFSTREINILDATFAVEQSRDHHYFRLSEDSLQEWDICLVNSDDLKALASLAKMVPSEFHPVLLVGMPQVELPYLAVQRPIRWLKLFDALDALIGKRDLLLAQRNPSHLALGVSPRERRRRERLDLDLTDPSEYERMRAKAPQIDRILVVDQYSTFRDDLALTMAAYVVPVEWAGDAASAAEVYVQQPISVVLINPRLPDLDPYFFCMQIKHRHQGQGHRISVIFLIEEGFSYDHELARQAGCDGFLMRELGQPQIFMALSKFLSLVR